MGKLQRSREITKKSLEIMKNEKELFIFPILSILFSILFILALSVPFLLSTILSELSTAIEYDITFYSIIFFMYLGLAFIATFFNMCTVYTVAEAFSKNNPTFKKTIKYAISKSHLILMWSIMSAIVGLLLFVIERMAERMKGLGGIALHITRGILGLAWGLATIFVVPVMVYKKLGPFQAIKESVRTLKKTWGEYFIKTLGVFLVMFLYLIIGIVIFIPVAILAYKIHIIAFLFTIIMLIIYIVIIIIIFGVFEKIFDTALYVYAETGVEVGGFNKDLLEGAFKKSKKPKIF